MIKIKRAAVLKAKLLLTEEREKYTIISPEQQRIYSITKGVYASRIFGLCIYRPNELKK